MLVLVVGFGLIVYLFIVTPATAATQLPLIVAAAGGIIPVLAKLGETEAKVDSAIVASKHNAIALESVSAQVGENTAVTETVKAQAESTHELVNGHMGEWRAALEKIAELEATIAGQAGNAAGRETGRQIAIDLLAANAQTPDKAPDQE